MSEVGFVEGRNIAIEYRWAENQYDRLPALGAGSSSPSGGGDCHARWKCGVTCCEAGDHHDSSRVLWQRRPGRSRTRCQPESAGRQRHWGGHAEYRYRTEAARTGVDHGTIRGRSCVDCGHYKPLSTCVDRIFVKQFLAPASKKKNAARPLGPYGGFGGP